MRGAIAAEDQEWEVVEQACLQLLESEKTERISAAVASPTFSWGRLIDHGLTHRLQVILAVTLLEEQYRDLLPPKIRRFFYDTVLLNRHRIRVYGEAVSRIVAAARARGIAVVLRKGLALEQTVYGAKGLRVFVDVDFMAAPDEAPALGEVLGDLGYVHGTFDLHRGCIVPHERRVQLLYRLNPDHLPKFVSLTTDPVTPCIEVDVAVSLSWERSDYRVELAEAFSSVMRISPAYASEPLPVFCPEYSFIDCTLHLFREAFIESAVGNGNPVTLSAFLDLALLWRRFYPQLTTPAARARLDRLGLKPPMAWVMWHLDRLFPTDVVDTLALHEFVDEAWMASWRPLGRESGRWHGDMRRRLIEGGAIKEAGA